MIRETRYSEELGERRRHLNESGQFAALRAKG
jgi:hypothetical protein